jgi:hypothetical protein
MRDGRLYLLSGRRLLVTIIGSLGDDWLTHDSRVLRS